MSPLATPVLATSVVEGLGILGYAALVVVTVRVAARWAADALGAGADTLGARAGARGGADRSGA